MVHLDVFGVCLTDFGLRWQFRGVFSHLLLPVMISYLHIWHVSFWLAVDLQILFLVSVLFSRVWLYLSRSETNETS